ncbi:hypothetical protein LEMLEM_LOCUS2721, partial [Lemmus lemmus]
FPPLACAAASLGAAGGGNSLALTLDWLARALGWGRPDAPEPEGRTTAVCVPTSRVSAYPGTCVQISRTVCRATECGQGRGDERDQVLDLERNVLQQQTRSVMGQDPCHVGNLCH